MANKIVLKKTSTAAKVPLSTDLDVGELAVNLADAKLFTKNASGTVIQLGGGGGEGDVVGPASATDNAITRYDGTTGKLIQNSNITLDDNGNLASVNAVTFDTTPATLPTAAGSMFWDEGNGSPTVILDADVALQLGQEMLALVYNGTGSTITNGSVVAVSGAQGQRPSVVLADADSEALSAPTLGIATEDIANGTEGFVTTFGFVRGINTSAFTAGAPVYLGTTAGTFTATRPPAPAHTVALGWVIKVNASSGEVFVNINNGWELDELHNVLITSPISGNTLIYDASAGVWKNANLTAGTGIFITNGAGSITIANSGVTSVSGTTAEIEVSQSTGAVTIGLPATTVTAGSYTNASLTVDVNGRLTAASSGTAPVTSVTGTAPVVSSGGTTPAISMAAASSTVSGYLTSTDWNTFNNKTSNTGTVTSVAATAGTGISISGSPITTSGTLTITNTAPDQVVSLTGAGATSISGTYPNFTITSTNTTYSPATSTVAGLIELGDDTVQTVAANAVTTTASRTYALQVNAAGQGVINVPWVNSGGTVTSVGGTGTVSGLTLTGTVTTSGNITLGGTLAVTASNFASQTANTFLAAPNGSAGTPTFRTIVAADVPTLNQNTTGSSGSVSGYTVFATSTGPTWGSTLANIQSNGLIEGGRYLDFHGTSADAVDYTVRLDGGGAGSTTLSLTGAFTASGNVTAFSDERLKKDWNTVDSNFVAKLANIKSGTYTRIDTNEKQAGISAQDMQKLLPETVMTSEDGTLSIAYGNAAMVACVEMAKVIQELRKEIAILKAGR